MKKSLFVFSPNDIQKDKEKRGIGIAVTVAPGGGPCTARKLRRSYLRIGLIIYKQDALAGATKIK